MARNTRRLTLAQECEIYLVHARAITAAVEVAAAQVSASRSSPCGLVRVNTGSAIARHRLVGWLPAHNCQLLSGFVRLAQWPMFKGGKRVLLPVECNTTCDSADVLLDMALAGIGIARFGDFLAERAITEGPLVPLLTDCHDADPTLLSALVLPGRQNIPRVRELIDFLKQA